MKDEVKPITRESFLAAFVDAHAHDYTYCEKALVEWAKLHAPSVWADEIDADPPNAKPRCEDCHPDHECRGAS